MLTLHWQAAKGVWLCFSQMMKMPVRAKEISGLLMSLLTTLEKNKPGLGLDEETDRDHCSSLAMRVFDKADKVDRAGKADLNTARAFYAASCFLEVGVLQAFSPLKLQSKSE